jgi:hypothetical protein
MRIVRVFGVILLGTLLLAGITAAQLVDEAVPAPITVRDIAGGGGGKTDGKSAAPLQRWDLQVKRGDDNSIAGRVDLGGSPLAAAGNVQGHIVGSSVTGTITDDDGKQVATFTGTITADGISGKYTDRTGETGEWSWDGPPPQ